LLKNSPWFWVFSVIFCALFTSPAIAGCYCCKKKKEREKKEFEKEQKNDLLETVGNVIQDTIVEARRSLGVKGNPAHYNNKDRDDYEYVRKK